MKTFDLDRYRRENNEARAKLKKVRADIQARSKQGGKLVRYEHNQEVSASVRSAKKKEISERAVSYVVNLYGSYLSGEVVERRGTLAALAGIGSLTTETYKVGSQKFIRRLQEKNRSGLKLGLLEREYIDKILDKELLGRNGAPRRRPSEELAIVLVYLDIRMMFAPEHFEYDPLGDYEPKGVKKYSVTIVCAAMRKLNLRGRGGHQISEPKLEKIIDLFKKNYADMFEVIEMRARLKALKAFYEEERAGVRICA